MESRYHAIDFEPASYVKRNPWIAPAVTTGLVAGSVAVARVVSPALATLLPSWMPMAVLLAGSFLSWRAAMLADTRSSRIVRFAAPALPLAGVAAMAFLSRSPVIG